MLTPPCVIMSEEDSDASSSVGESEGEISEPKSKTDLVKIEHLKIIRTIGTGNRDLRCFFIPNTSVKLLNVLRKVG